MKKLIVGIAVAAMMALGLVGVTGTSAVACAPNYTGTCLPTKTVAKAPKKIAKGTKAKVRVRVRSTAGDYTPQGSVVVRCKNGRAKRVAVRSVSGHSRTVKIKLNKKGTWKCVARYRGVNTTDSRSTFKIRVR